MSPTPTCSFKRIPTVACTGLLLAVLYALVTSACRSENPNHCLHKAEDADAWCSIEHTGLPYCSPCEAKMNGCVAEPPTAELCPLVGSTSSSSSGSASTTGT
ncbi:MAG TPA: hypothetical protein ENJ18_11780 [Nannocystis exedens]|nr:hypothetical protein [Nannocystis exedens]